MLAEEEVAAAVEKLTTTDGLLDHKLRYYLVISNSVITVAKAHKVAFT